jgi:hypothetical protein
MKWESETEEREFITISLLAGIIITVGIILEVFF